MQKAHNIKNCILNLSVGIVGTTFDGLSCSLIKKDRTKNRSEEKMSHNLKKIKNKNNAAYNYKVSKHYINFISLYLKSKFIQ